MRLWTFQDKVAFGDIEKYGIWYSDYDYERRLKLVDEEYIKEVNTPTGVKETMPIYCFASFGRWYPYLCLATMYAMFNRFVGWMQFPLSRMVMFELEVPESFIITSKKHNYWYQDYVNMPDGTPEEDKWKYLSVVNADEIEHTNHLQYKRSNEGDDTESLIPYITKEHIAAVRTFSSIHGGDDIDYGTCKVKTVYVGSEVPMWSADIYVNGDGYPRILEGKKLVNSGNLRTVKKLQAEYGMYTVYPYMTVEEIANCCNEQVIKLLQSKLDKAGLAYKDVRYLQYDELLNKLR